VSDSELVARQVTVHGRVQGVFFRDSCRREAEEHGVGGWVQNLEDGTVQAIFEGSPDAVASMVAWTHDGPRHAFVKRVDVVDTELTGLTEFRLRG